MILKGASPGGIKFVLKNLLWLTPFAGLILVMLSINESRDIGSAERESRILFRCDLETWENDFFFCKDLRLKGAFNRSNQYARSGTHSMVLNANQRFGLEFLMPVDHREELKLSVWTYNPAGTPAFLVATGEDSKIYYQATDVSNHTDVKGWKKLEIMLQVPRIVDTIKVYCHVTDVIDDVYFDDLTLERSILSAKDFSNETPAIHIRVSENDLKTLQTKRDRAWSEGLLITTNDSWVAAEITEGEKTHSAKIRLKGDWLDHLRRDKWSFRIKMDDGLWGMREFSVQTPETRGFLREWIYHQWLLREDILSPKYRFSSVHLNGKFLGLYAVEEHFEKELVEKQDRREGVIVKFSEERFWQGVRRQFASGGKNNFIFSDELEHEQSFQSAAIESFNENQTLESPLLSSHFKRASQLMLAYKYGTQPLHQFIDSRLLGRYLAIVDLTKAYHSLSWHNQRWYYNPVTDRLEPIGFDGFTTEEPILFAGAELIADASYQNKTPSFEPFNRFFQDPEIMTHYLAALFAFTHEDYVRSLINEIEGETRHYQEELNNEYPEYYFDIHEILQRAQVVRANILPYEQTSVRASLLPDRHQSVEILNNHRVPIEITGIYSDARSYTQIDPVWVQPKAQSVRGYTLDLPFAPSRIYYSIPGLDSSYTLRIEPWEAVKMPSSGLTSNYTTHPLCDVLEKEIILGSGTLDTPLVIPDGFTVVIPSGTKIDIVSGAFIYSRSAIHSRGDDEDHIVIHSSDGSGSLIVMQAKEPSYFSHTHFDNLGTLDHEAYILTGGVNLYESSSDWSHCHFSNSQEEDALNIIRSDFSIRNCLFQNTAFDAFDADFCKGNVESSWFRNTGNDAMDFSGSTVTVKNVQMEAIGDKGISVGERSYVHVHEAKIISAATGVASKDQSTLTIDYIEIHNTTVGFTAFQKKPTYGPASIEVTDYQTENVKHLHIIESGSTLLLHGKPILIQ